MSITPTSKLSLAALAALLLALSPRPARAHCDTLDGPVVADARAALASQDATPALEWVSPGAEPEIREAFQRALAVRAWARKRARWPTASSSRRSSASTARAKGRRTRG